MTSEGPFWARKWLGMAIGNEGFAWISVRDGWKMLALGLRLGRVVIFNAPSWANMAFRFASAFLSQKTLSKVWIHRQKCLGQL